MQDFLSVASGIVVGFFLGLTGGGGSILAVPLILYVTGIADAHMAIGTGAATVLGTAILNLFTHARNGNVRWNYAVVFSVAGVSSVALGSTLGKQTDSHVLLTMFSVLMIGIAVLMQRRRKAAAGTDDTLSLGVAAKLAGTAVVVGFLAGFFGIGGGFLIVPGLIFASRMATIDAIGSSLLCVTAFSSMTTINYALSGLVSWHIAADYIAGGVFGSMIGPRLARRISYDQDMLNRLFGSVLVVVALYIICRSAFPIVGKSPTPFNPIRSPKQLQYSTVPPKLPIRRTI